MHIGHRWARRGAARVAAAVAALAVVVPVPAAADCASDMVAAEAALARGEAEEAAARFRAAWREAEAVPGQMTCIAAALTGLGDALTVQGRHAEAVTPYRRAVSVLESIHGRGHLDVAVSLVALGTAMFRAKPDTAAEPILQRALDIRRARLGAHPAVAEVLDLIASVRFANAEAVSAEGLRGDADRIRATHRR